MPRHKSKTNWCKTCNVLLTNENWLEYLKPRSNYLCTPCFRQYGKNHYHQTTLRPPCDQSDPATTQNERLKKLSKNRYWQAKCEAINKYGGKCLMCGETNLNVLTIDHIYGGGSKHRKAIKYNTYLWLKKKNYPAGFQTLCYNCNCSKNTYKNNNYKYKNYDLINKTKVIKHYGGKCALCGEINIEKLTIDHKNNDGAKHRKETGCGTGQRFYRWIIKNNYPENTFQVLCFNCNCSKRACKWLG